MRGRYQEWQTIEVDISSVLAETHNLLGRCVESQTVTSTDMYAWNRLQARTVILARLGVTDWNASVTLGNRPVQVDIIISNSRGPYSIESIVFLGGWQG